MRVVLLLGLVGAALGFATDYDKSYSANATLIKSAILSGYDKSLPPTSDRMIEYSAAGTDVEVEIVFYKLNKVDVPSGHLEIKCWLRMNWVDERLKWVPADYAGVTQLFMHASSFSAPGDSEIWLPDITPYNAVSGLMGSFDPALAKVSSTGAVAWSRPGMLELICRFSGLINFPSDRLECQFDLDVITAPQSSEETKRRAIWDVGVASGSRMKKVE